MRKKPGYSKAFSPETKLNSVYFFMQLSDNWHFFIGNIRLAVGARIPAKNS